MLYKTSMINLKALVFIFLNNIIIIGIIIIATLSSSVQVDHQPPTHLLFHCKLRVTLLLCAGGPPGGRAHLRAGEVQGDQRGARADLRRDVRLLEEVWKSVKILKEYKKPHTSQRCQHIYCYIYVPLGIIQESSRCVLRSFVNYHQSVYFIHY